MRGGGTSRSAEIAAHRARADLLGHGQAFFFIPGSDTCLRLSGRARFEYAYQPSYSRSGTAAATPGDYSGYQGRLRINLDARTQTSYGTLRAFLRLDAGSRTGFATMHAGALRPDRRRLPGPGRRPVPGGPSSSSTSTRPSSSSPASPPAAPPRSSTSTPTTLEFIVASIGSDTPSTNLAAYTATLGQGLSASPVGGGPRCSAARRSIRRPRTPLPGDPSTPAPSSRPGTPSPRSSSGTTPPAARPAWASWTRSSAAACPTSQSACCAPTSPGAPRSSLGRRARGQPRLAQQRLVRRHEPGRARLAGQQPRPARGGLRLSAGAVQGGVKSQPAGHCGRRHLCYLQGAYGEGAALCTGLPAYNGPYAQAATAVQGAAFSQFFQRRRDQPLHPAPGPARRATRSRRRCSITGRPRSAPPSSAPTAP
ncbi:porin [Methylobacterium oryzae CBMB20]